MAVRNQEYIATKKMLDILRESKGMKISSKKSLLMEEDKKDDKKDDRLKDAIAITNDPKFGENVLDNQIEQFRAAVDSGAEFSEEEDSENVANNPLIYLPSNGNLIFSGIIPRMNNLKFQLLLKTNTGDGCFLWADGLILNNENMKTLSKLYGFYQNWVEAWTKESKDFKTLAKAEKEKED